MWQLKVDALNFSAKQWFKELLNPDNNLAISVEQKDKMLVFAIVVLEYTWLMRNKLLHGEQIPDWTDIGSLMARKVEEHWQAFK